MRAQSSQQRSARLETLAGPTPQRISRFDTLAGPATPLEFTPPERFDDYVVLGLLGRGAMGHVYLGEDAVLARRVAIKFVSEPEPDDEARRRFLTEARAAARVQHPNVVTIYRVGELDQRPYIVTEFVRGKTLAELEKPLPWDRALAIGLDLARGLAAAHRSGVLHCDIKSANAILTDEGVAKLLDFGLATLVRTTDDAPRASNHPAVRGEKVVRGTPNFVAPELWRGLEASTASDVYALGALLYELASGRLPFSDVPMRELPKVVQTRLPRPLREIEGGVDARLSAIVERCLAKSPSARFADGGAVLAALEDLAAPHSGAIPEGNPFRGLRPFEAEHRPLFFGRRAETRELYDRLRAQPIVLVTGDSGVGKSSICRASVVPAVLAEGLGDGRTWGVATMTPGARPLSALTSSIADLLGIDGGGLLDELRATPRSFAAALSERLGDRAGLLLLVDELEELLSLSDPEEATAFETALASFDGRAPNVRLLATIRGDFLTRLASRPLAVDLSRVLYFLKPLSRERVRDVIVGPARATGAQFESDALIETLVDATPRDGGGLSLLQFALVELWESRTLDGNVMTIEALAAMGGVGGALARHADDVVASLAPDQRAAARRMLVRLVGSDKRRVQRTEADLVGDDDAAHAALERLVRARLLTPHDDDRGSAYRLAHDVLISSWAMLERWLNEDAEGRFVRERLAHAAAEWERLGGVGEALWGARQLDELEGLTLDDLPPFEHSFIERSREKVRRLRWTRRALAIGLPLAILGAYGTFELVSRHAVQKRVDAGFADARSALDEASALEADAELARRRAFASFDALDRAQGEEAWSSALAAEGSADKKLALGARALEAALAQDPGRDDVRAALAEALYGRALVAERTHRADQRDELLERLSVYDAHGEVRARWTTPGRLSLTTKPPGARVRLERYDEVGDRLVENPVGYAGATPIADYQLSPGSYVGIVTAPGHTDVRVPFVLARAERLALEIDLPRAADLRPGFVYVPRGRFLFGSAADEGVRRGFFDAIPMHEVTTDAFLVATQEVTYGEWMEFLRSLSPSEREARRPKTPARVNGSVELTASPAGFILALQPSLQRHLAKEGEALHYPGRKELETQDWTRLPVTGMSGDDALAYVGWLVSSGRLPGARLCTEVEWERAARGADGREYPEGHQLPASEANIDETHGRDQLGPDEVGSHPASRSPFGIDDASGNAFEWTRSSLARDELVVRGGSFFHDQKTARLENRTVSTSSLRDPTLGLRVCATPR